MMHNVPWLSNMLFWIPGANKNINKIVNFTNNMTRRRQENGSMTKDLFHHLVSLLVPHHRLASLTQFIL